MSLTIADQADRVAELARTDRPGMAALELARFAYPALQVDAYIDRLDAIASRVEGDTHLALRRQIAIAEGIGGNVDDYYAPENSYLNRVLDTRRGIPISLSLVWIEVGRRAGIEVVGVGLPGHFVVYAAGQMVDPFHYGEAIGFDEAASLVAGALGGAPRLDQSWLSPVPSDDLIRRMCRNLASIFDERGDQAGSEWVAACLDALS